MPSETVATSARGRDRGWVHEICAAVCCTQREESQDRRAFPDTPHDEDFEDESPQVRVFRADNSRLQATTDGMALRRSLQLHDVCGSDVFVPWGAVVHGRKIASGVWIDVSRIVSDEFDIQVSQRRYLPMKLRGVPVLLQQVLPRPPVLPTTEEDKMPQSEHPDPESHTTKNVVEQDSVPENHVEVAGVDWQRGARSEQARARIKRHSEAAKVERVRHEQEQVIRESLREMAEEERKQLQDVPSEREMKRVSSQRKSGQVAAAELKLLLSSGKSPGKQRARGSSGEESAAASNGRITPRVPLSSNDEEMAKCKDMEYRDEFEPGQMRDHRVVRAGFRPSP